MVQLSYYRIIERPLLTEKSTVLADIRNQYFFRVDPRATKPEIKKAVEAIFAVKVKKVNVIVMPGKLRRIQGRPGRTTPWKKAIVTLQAGQAIELA
jgi:large subunit ribosomal protein L23